MSIYSQDSEDPFIFDMMLWMRANPLVLDDVHIDEKIPGPKHTQDVKNQISQSNKEYYKTHEGVLRRQSISENNRKLKSDELKRRWKEDPEYMYSISASKGGRRKGSKDLGPRKPRLTQKVTDGTTVYETAMIASVAYGIHVVNIRYKCRNLVNGWRYVND